jgi:hypothetical protein
VTNGAASILDHIWPLYLVTWYAIDRKKLNTESHSKVRCFKLRCLHDEGANKKCGGKDYRVCPAAIIVSKSNSIAIQSSQPTSNSTISSWQRHLGILPHKRETRAHKIKVTAIITRFTLRYTKIHPPSLSTSRKNLHPIPFRIGPR